MCTVMCVYVSVSESMICDVTGYYDLDEKMQLAFLF